MMMKRTLVRTLMAVVLVVGPVGLLAPTAHAAPKRQWVEVGSTTGGTFNDSRCNRYGHEINDLLGDAYRLRSEGKNSAAKQAETKAQGKQDEAMDNGCFVVNPV